jgi:MFS family permease
LSRDLILLSLALLTWGIGEGMFFNFRPLYLEQLGADPRQIGAILGGVGLAMTVVNLPAGYLSDRFGRRPLLYAAWLLGTIAAWVMALARSLPIFVLGAVIYGLTNFVLVPLNSYITAARGRWSVGRAITLVSAAFNLGSVLGPLIGGLIGERLGMKNSFLAAAWIFVASSLMVFFIRAQPVDAPATERSLSEIKGVLKPSFVRYLIVIFVVMFVLFLPQPLSQNFLVDVRNVSLIQIGQLLSVTSIGVVLLNLLLGQLNASLGFVLAQAAMALFAIFIWRGQSLTWYFMAYFLLGSYRTARSLATAQGRSLVEGRQMGIAYGWIETIASVAMFLAPPLAGVLYSIEPALVYPISIGLIGAGILFTLLFSPLRSQEVL